MLVHPEKNNNKMTELTFDRDHAEKAIELARDNGQAWLYESYPKPNGQMRKSSTGFLLYEGVAYPVKPLGRLANKLAGNPMTNNPITNVFRRYFEGLGFQLIENADNEAEIATKRQRRLADVWERPGQAKFRRVVFEMFGARCLISGCENLTVLEAAHVVPVSSGGGDDAWNGIPLRADLHRLFDAGYITIESDGWTLIVAEAARKDYGQYHGMDLSKIEGSPKFVTALNKRRLLGSEKM